jgi:hypothetical protein
MARLVLVLLFVGFAARADAQRASARPTFAQITTLAEHMGLRHIAVHGAPLPFGTPQRFVAVVSSSVRAVSSQDDVRDATLLVLERGDAGFTLQSSVTLPIAPRANMYEERRGRDFTIATWRAEDVDADGELELVMVVRWIVAVVCGPGQLWESELIIVDLVPRASIALALALESYSESGVYERRGHAAHEDRNGDGHPDVRVRFRDCDLDDEGEERCDAPRYVDYLWDAARDVFSVSTPPSARAAPCQGG